MEGFLMGCAMLLIGVLSFYLGNLIMNFYLDIRDDLKKDKGSH